MPVTSDDGTPCGPDPACVAWALGSRQAKLFVSLTKNQDEGYMTIWFAVAAEPRLTALQFLVP